MRAILTTRCNCTREIEVQHGALEGPPPFVEVRLLVRPDFSRSSFDSVGSQPVRVDIRRFKFTGYDKSVPPVTALYKEEVV